MAGAWPAHAQTTLNGQTVDVDDDTPFPPGLVTFEGADSTLEFNGSFTVDNNMVFETGVFGIMDTNDAANTDTLSGGLSGGGGLVKDGDGKLILSGVNSFTGGTSVNAGILEVTGSLTPNSTVDVAAGAEFIVNNSTSATFSGTINLEGVSWINPYGTFAKEGAGTLAIDGATISGGEAYVRGGTVAQTSGNTSIDYFAVGTGTTSGNPNLGGLDVSGGTLNIGVAMQVGDFGGTGTVNQTGGTVRLLPTCSDPARCAALNIGNQGGTGVYNISGGTLELNGGLHNIGRSAGNNPPSDGTLNISGNGLVWLRPASDPAFGMGDLIIGSRASTGSPLGQGEGTINQTGGTLRVENASNLFLSGYGDGTYNLLGGTLEIGGNSFRENYQGGAAYEFNFGDGTIQVLDTALVTSVDANLVSGATATIDTNGIGATWNGILSGDGALEKIGDGTLVLNQINTYTAAPSSATARCSLALQAFWTRPAPCMSMRMARSTSTASGSKSARSRAPASSWRRQVRAALVAWAPAIAPTQLSQARLSAGSSRPDPAR